MAPRWGALTATSTRLLQTQGAELHRAGLNALDLFWLHATALVTNPPGWGLAWLLGSTGEVLDVASELIGSRGGLDGARLTYRRHIRPVIPSKSNQRRQPRFDREAYRQRNHIERLINHLKQFRRITTRYEKRGINYLAMVMLGMILLWL